MNAIVMVHKMQRMALNTSNSQQSSPTSKAPPMDTTSHLNGPPPVLPRSQLAAESGPVGAKRTTTTTTPSSGRAQHQAVDEKTGAGLEVAGEQEGLEPSLLIMPRLLALLA